MLRKLACILGARVLVIAVTSAATLRNLAPSLIALCRRLARTIIIATVTVLSTIADTIAAFRSNRLYNWSLINNSSLLDLFYWRLRNIIDDLRMR
jgi:hypothetical protein